MATREVVGIILLSLVLLAAAVAINGWMLWSSMANMTMAWLCSAMAVALLIMGSLSLLTGKRPEALPRLYVVTVWAIVQVVFGVGMIGDAFVYYSADDLWLSAAEWIGFGIILGGAIMLPRFANATDRSP